MSNRVKIGAIGNNPLIEEINRLNVMDIQGYAVKRMEELLFVESPNELDWYEERINNTAALSGEGKNAE